MKKTDLEKQVQEELTWILKDTVADYKKIVKRMQSTIIFLVVMLVGVCIYYEYNFKNFLSQYDYTNEVIENNIEADTNGNGTIYDLKNNTNIGK